MVNKQKILIVDDVEINRLVLEEIIRNMGCEPLLAENGEKALELAVKCLPKLILSDISIKASRGCIMKHCFSFFFLKKTKRDILILTQEFS